MAHLHSRGILHRDLKPSNILLNDQFEPVIAGLDMSRDYDGGLNLTSAVGAPLFMAPEIYDDEGYDFAVDVYSFAVTLHQMFTGTAEMDDGRGPARGAPQLMRRTIGGARFTRPPEIPDSLWELITRCWAKDPKARPTFRGILDEFQGGRGYVLPGADQAAVLEYEGRVGGQLLPGGGPGRSP
jgi:serine/threonine protein kinase